MATTTLNRRDFLRAGAALSAAAGVLAQSDRAVRAQGQAPGGSARRPHRYEEDVLFEHRHHIFTTGEN